MILAQCGAKCEAVRSQLSQHCPNLLESALYDLGEVENNDYQFTSLI